MVEGVDDGVGALWVVAGVLGGDGECVEGGEVGIGVVEVDGSPEYDVLRVQRGWAGQAVVEEERSCRDMADRIGHALKELPC